MTARKDYADTSSAEYSRRLKYYVCNLFPAYSRFDDAVMRRGRKPLLSLLNHFLFPLNITTAIEICAIPNERILRPSFGNSFKISLGKLEGNEMSIIHMFDALYQIFILFSI